MALIVRYNEKHTSVSEFMYYVAERMEKKNPLTRWETLNLYKVYTDYCELKDINYLSRIAFARLVREYGFRADYLWDKGQKKSVRVFTIDEEVLLKKLKMFTNKINVTEHITYIFIGGKKYRVKSTYELIDDLVPIDTPETEEVINQNPDPTGESV